jgi:hypothetical protein
MSIREIRKAYKDLKEHVFSHVVAPTDNDPLFDEERLERWAKALVQKYTGDENSRMIPASDHEYGEFGNIRCKGCKV